MLKAEDFTKGIAYLAHGPDFLFAFDSAKPPQLIINDEPGPRMKRLKDNRWVATVPDQVTEPDAMN